MMKNHFKLKLRHDHHEKLIRDLLPDGEVAGIIKITSTSHTHSQCLWMAVKYYDKLILYCT